MIKKLLLFFLAFAATIHFAKAQSLITLPKTINKPSDLLKISFSAHENSGKPAFVFISLYYSGKLVSTGNSNNFTMGENNPGDIFFTRHDAVDTSFNSIILNDTDLPQGDYEVVYKVTSLKPKEVILTQSEKFVKSKGGHRVITPAVTKSDRKPEDKNDTGAVKSAATNDAAKIIFSGYANAYYAYYTDSVGIGDFQKFPAVSPRSDHIGLNTAAITAQYDGEKTRGIITLHFGDIPRATWSPTFNPVMEAHVGFRLNQKLWFDAGFFRTHFGTEGLYPKENLMSSISVNTFYEPVLEAGVRLNYNPNEKLSLNLYLLNGYNLFEDNNHKKSVGLLVSYALGDKGNLNYCNYIGDDSPFGDTIAHTRISQNIYWNYSIKKLKIQIGADVCMQQNSHITYTDKMASMFSGIATLKYQLENKVAISARGEIFDDPEGFMSGVFADKTGLLTGFRLYGLTFGAEYKPFDNVWLRVEERALIMDKNQEIFHWDNRDSRYRHDFTIDLGVSF